QLRLSDGDRDSQGRVEIYHNNTWGTICDDGFNQNVATVICRKLGYTGNFRTYAEAYFGIGSGPIWLDDVDCNGNEQNLINCRLKPWGRTNCRHGEDAGLDCAPGKTHANIPVRLAGGADGSQGRVEIQHAGEWGTVCDDGFDDNAAKVVCRQLNFKNVIAVPLTSAYFTNGTGDPSKKILLDDVKCTGNETGLGVCLHKGWGTTNCQHSEDAGVMCIPKAIKVRLTGGLSRNQGRVELNVYGIWGTVCDDSFSSRDAGVICKMLNYTRGGKKLRKGTYSGGLGPIWVDDLGCQGPESNITQCSKKPWGVNNCDHDEDVAILCTKAPPLQIQLDNGEGPYEGRVMVMFNDEWGSVCDDNWGPEEAQVVCRMLGFNATGAIAKSRAWFGQGSGKIWLDDVNCKGSELTLSQCGHRTWGQGNCRHSEDASVICLHVVDPNYNISVRLVGSGVKTAGRVEVFYRGQWGTVCDDNWDSRNAKVVCRMLGLPMDKSRPYIKAHYGSGSGPILLDDVGCDGTENNILECSNKGWGDHDCTHRDDAGVDCNPVAPLHDVKVRLKDGPSPYEGRLEVYYNEKWGTVCDDGFNQDEAKVVCKMLGVSDVTKVLVKNRAQYGSGTGPIWLDNVRCIGNESSITDCNHNAWGLGNCGHSEDVGLKCSSSLQVRLTNGSDQTMGRVEVLHNGTWGTVCDDLWGIPEATVVCNQLGMPNTIPIPLPNGYFGLTNSPIWLDDVVCNGSETGLGDCQFKPWGFNNCEQDENAGVICLKTVLVRLIDGLNQFQGRVEVFYHGIWGSICDDSFDTRDASVVCKMLGYGPEATLRSFSGSTRGPIWMDDLECTGQETSIDKCRFKGWGETNCDHKEDVAMVCTNRKSLQLFLSCIHHRSARLRGKAKFFSKLLSPQRVMEGHVSPMTLLLLEVQHSVVTGFWLIILKGWSESIKSSVNVRLVDGNSPDEGRVEIYYNGTWGTLCDDNWNANNARVVCRMLNKTTEQVTARGAGFFPRGHGKIWLDELNCIGNETNIEQCGHRSWGKTNCRHEEDAGVVCGGAPNTKLRLINSRGLPNQGRVEIMINNTWGTICDDMWDSREASVVCAMMGFSSGAVAKTRAFFGRGSGPIFLDDVTCDGSESNIFECSTKPIGKSNCNHREDAGVICKPSDIQIRLVDGDPSKGRLELFHNNTWGTVCDDYFNNKAASVVCKMMGKP
ncbi:hypothetical protein LOTGIDRAFT_129408, partial [Lottia gigantea]